MVFLLRGGVDDDSMNALFVVEAKQLLHQFRAAGAGPPPGQGQAMR
jgi:hypothetical protein